MDSTAACRSWNSGYGKDIIISDIAGRFPSSDNVNHLRENLKIA